MNIFKREKTPKNNSPDHSAMAEIALNSIHDGVIIADKNGVIRYINPSAATMTNYPGNRAVGLDYSLVVKLETKEGRELSDKENPLVQAMQSGQILEPTQASLIVNQTDQRIPVSVSMQVSNDAQANRVITFRDITKELAEEGEQAEFISTASHEMRTPVATIDGYLMLCLNPQTATVDERARNYLTAAEKASKHLGKLFQDLLDVTKLDDGRIKPHLVPVEMIGLVQSISDDYAMQAKEANLTYSFGSSEPVSFGSSNRRLTQVVYGYVDVDFIREILGNLITNAIKYTPSGGSIYVNVRGDGDRVLINVTDTGMGISAEDLGHIFQKFYRVDNSDTRTIGGTGLGLYIVKQRTEAMGGKVWAESAFGEGSTFYVSLPRISSDEYEKRMIAVKNQEMIDNGAQVMPAQGVMQPQPATFPAPPAPPVPQMPPAAATLPTQPQMASPTLPAQPQMAPPTLPAQPAPQPQPVQPAQPIQSAQPAQAIQSAQPTQPTPPAQPTQPTPPAQPTQPTPPAQPAQPVQPVRPVPTTPPTRPAQPTPLTQPARPIQPAQPTQTIQPAQPTQTIQPAQPARPAQPAPTTPLPPPIPIPPPVPQTPSNNSPVQTLTNNNLNGENK